MTKKRRRKFSKEFKREAVRLLRAHPEKGITAIASELSVTVSVLRSWVEMVEAEEKTGLTPDELDELKQLRKDKARLEREVEILGEATAFFANRRR